MPTSFEHLCSRAEAGQRRPQLVADVGREASVAHHALGERDGHLVEGVAETVEVTIARPRQPRRQVAGGDGRGRPRRPGQRVEDPPGGPDADQRAGHRGYRRRAGEGGALGAEGPVELAQLTDLKVAGAGPGHGNPHDQHGRAAAVDGALLGGPAGQDPLAHGDRHRVGVGSDRRRVPAVLPEEERRPARCGLQRPQHLRDVGIWGPEARRHHPCVQCRLGDAELLTLAYEVAPGQRRGRRREHYRNQERSEREGRSDPGAQAHPTHRPRPSVPHPGIVALQARIRRPGPPTMTSGCHLGGPSSPNRNTTYACPSRRPTMLSVRRWSNCAADG